MGRPAAKKVTGKGKTPAKAGTSKAAAHARKLKFVEGLIANDENVTVAAKIAGFSPKTASSQGSRLLKDVEVQQMLRERRGVVLSKLELTTEAVLRSLAQSLFFDPRKLYRQDGTLKDADELDDDTAMALTGIEIAEEFGQIQGADGETKRMPIGRTAKVKWLDKTAAREQAMKHLGMFKADNTQRTLLGDVPRDKLKAIVARLVGG